MSSRKPEGLVMRYSWAIGMIGTLTPTIRPISGANMPPALTTTSAPISDRSPLCSTVTPVTGARSGGEREGQSGGVEPAIGRQVDRPENAVGRQQRKERLGIRRADQLERQAERLGPAGL